MLEYRKKEEIKKILFFLYIDFLILIPCNKYKKKYGTMCKTFPSWISRKTWKFSEKENQEVHPCIQVITGVPFNRSRSGKWRKFGILF